jgi:hypothetical protein
MRRWGSNARTPLSENQVQARNHYGNGEVTIHDYTNSFNVASRHTINTVYLKLGLPSVITTVEKLRSHVPKKNTQRYMVLVESFFKAKKCYVKVLKNLNIFFACAYYLYI